MSLSIFVNHFLWIPPWRWFTNVNRASENERMQLDIADFIKSRIEEIPGMSFRKLEMLSGVSRSEISYIINKKRKRPGPKILRAMAPHLKVKYEYLLFLSGYLSEESWTVIEEESLKSRQKDLLAKNEIAEPMEIYRSLGLLSAEEKNLLDCFRMLKDPQSKSFLNYFIQLALKAGQNT